MRPRSRSPHRNSRFATLAFGAVLAGAFPLLLVLGRQMWFFLDDWSFLAGREATDPDDLLRPHFVHWSTLPILVYRVLYRLVGLRSYLPYQTLIVVLHLTAAALLRVIMRRAGVSPWISTAAAALFVLLGSGYQNIVWAFQIGFVGALVLGLTHLLLADHDGSFDRRDWLGLLAGTAGLLCSGVAVTMAVVVGLATLVRRGWRVAALHTAPLGALYLAWWLGFGRDAYVRDTGSPDLWARFVANGVEAAFDAMGQLPGVGIALGVLLVVGLPLAWGPLEGAERRRRAAAPGALLIGVIVFLVVTALGRVVLLGPEFARSSRYTHLVAAMTLPAIAVAADAVARRWRVLAPAVVAALVVGIPGNIDALANRDGTRFHEDVQRANRQFILSVPRVPIADDVPRRVEPDPTSAYDVTVGWLRDGVASGRIPEPREIEPVQSASITLRLALAQSNERTDACQSVDAPVTQRLEKGESVGFRAESVRVVYVAEDGTSSEPRTYLQVFGTTLSALAGPLTLRMEPGEPAPSLVLCTRATQPQTVTGSSGSPGLRVTTRGPATTVSVLPSLGS